MASEQFGRYLQDLEEVRRQFGSDDMQSVFSCQLLLSVRDYLQTRPPADLRLEAMSVGDIIALVSGDQV